MMFLQISAKRIIVNIQGTIIDSELQSPFAYLTALANDLGTPKGPIKSGSTQLPLVTQHSPMLKLQLTSYIGHAERKPPHPINNGTYSHYICPTRHCQKA